MEFVFTGFQQDANIRHYAFQGIGEDRRGNFKVGVDMATARRYGIPLQDLPLLCRRLLETRDSGKAAAAVMFTEDEMRGYANVRADRQREAEHKKRFIRRPVPSRQTGKAWR